MLIEERGCAGTAKFHINEDDLPTRQKNLTRSGIVNASTSRQLFGVPY